MSFTFEPLAIPEVILITPDAYPDERGFFMETYRHSAFVENGITEQFVQQNVSHSKKDVLRGLHFQTGPTAQGKLVRCARGEIFDVAVDVRPDSSTFGTWVGAILSGDNRQELYIPPGFAHGFCVTSDEAEVAYSCTSEYDAASERGLRWDDPNIGIAWPVAHPILSEKDARNPLLQDYSHDNRP